MQYVIDHSGDILSALTAIVAAAAAVATVFGKSDNKYLEGARKVIGFLALNFGAAKNAADVKPTDVQKS